MRFGPVFVLAAATLALGGCSKRYVDFTVTNQSGGQVHTLEIDYPGGSFGTTKLEPGQTFHYRFKPLHNGSLKLIFEDAASQSHESAGPQWGENQGGRISTVIQAGSLVTWQTQKD